MRCSHIVGQLAQGRRGTPEQDVSALIGIGPQWQRILQMAFTEHRRYRMLCPAILCVRLQLDQPIPDQRTKRVRQC
jgi:hypothetical protein